MLCSRARHLRRLKTVFNTIHDVDSNKIALQVADGMLHASNLSRKVAKSRGSFYFSCNSQRNNCSCKMGCYTGIFSCNLQHKLQEKLLRVTWPLLSNFNKQDKMQLLDMGFRATLNFRKFKVALNLMYGIFLNFAKSCILCFLPEFDNEKKNSPCRF